MNCLLETVAGIFLQVRRKVIKELPEEEIYSAQDNLEQSRHNMEAREAVLIESINKLAQEAIKKRKEGDASAARSRMLDRRRTQKRLDKLRGGMCLVDSQIDAIKNSELDKELMYTLKASTNAMRKAGIGVGIEDVENVMNDLDESMRELQDVTSVLANPMGGPADVDEALDLDAELDALLEIEPSTPLASARKTQASPDKRVSVNAISTPVPVQPRERIQSVSIVEPSTVQGMIVQE